MNTTDIDEFVGTYVTGRRRSLFEDDIEANSDILEHEIRGKSALVIGGAGSIGSSFIKALLRYEPSKLVVVDINENGLVGLTRDLRSSFGITVPPVYLTYAIDFADTIFTDIYNAHGGFDIVANFSAHKHVRSEKDKYSVAALIKNNILKARGLLTLMATLPPKHFFCVSTDKAANPVNVMGASKRILEDLIKDYKDTFKVTTARFANVAFSNGSLPASFEPRLAKCRPLVAPRDVKRYFVSLEESGQICLLACILGRSGEIFYPKLDSGTMKTFSDICTDFLRVHGMKPRLCEDDAQAKSIAAARDFSQGYPVVYFDCDTSGEKESEEFVVEGEQTDTSRYKALGVIVRSVNPGATQVQTLVSRLEALIESRAFTKEQIIDIMETYLPNFRHIETGRNLDQRM